MGLSQAARDAFDKPLQKVVSKYQLRDQNHNTVGVIIDGSSAIHKISCIAGGKEHWLQSGQSLMDHILNAYIKRHQEMGCTHLVWMIDTTSKPYPREAYLKNKRYFNRESQRPSDTDTYSITDDTISPSLDLVAKWRPTVFHTYVLSRLPTLIQSFYPDMHYACRYPDGTWKHDDQFDWQARLPVIDYSEVDLAAHQLAKALQLDVVYIWSNDSDHVATGTLLQSPAIMIKDIKSGTRTAKISTADNMDVFVPRMTFTPTIVEIQDNELVLTTTDGQGRRVIGTVETSLMIGFQVIRLVQDKKKYLVVSSTDPQFEVMTVTDDDYTLYSPPEFYALHCLENYDMAMSLCFLMAMSGTDSTLYEFQRCGWSAPAPIYYAVADGGQSLPFLTLEDQTITLDVSAWRRMLYKIHADHTRNGPAKKAVYASAREAERFLIDRCLWTVAYWMGISGHTDGPDALQLGWDKCKEARYFHAIPRLNDPTFDFVEHDEISWTFSPDSNKVSCSLDTKRRRLDEAMAV